MNKRGLSQVVTTVLIILIVLAAIILIWIAVRPTIQSATEQVTADCVTLELQVSDCLDNGDSTTTLTIDRYTGKGTMTGMKFFFETTAGVTTLVDLFDSDVSETGFPPVELGQMTATVPTGYNGESANIAPVVGNDIICPVSSYAAAECDTTP
jgi:hypothetical protein